MGATNLHSGSYMLLLPHSFREIDILEAINVMPNNQMALHTTPGCTHPSTASELGVAGMGDCSTAAGCTVMESSPNSFESGFALMGGGVWACQFDVAGIL